MKGEGTHSKKCKGDSSDTAEDAAMELAVAVEQPRQIPSCNCRGLGNSRTVRKLCHLAREKRPESIFLIEIKVQQMRMEQIKWKVGMSNGLMINPIGLKGGLVLLWTDEVDLEIINFSSFHIHSMIKNSSNSQCWHLTAFYGNPETSKRNESWQLL